MEQTLTQRYHGVMVSCHQWRPGTCDTLTWPPGPQLTAAAISEIKPTALALTSAVFSVHTSSSATASFYSSLLVDISWLSYVRERACWSSWPRFIILVAFSLQEHLARKRKHFASPWPCPCGHWWTSQMAEPFFSHPDFTLLFFQAAGHEYMNFTPSTQQMVLK